MTKIYLLKPYQGHGSNVIIAVSNFVANGLIGQGIARECRNRDFLVKPEFGKSKAIDTRKLSRRK